jgi:hypothetical protein
VRSALDSLESKHKARFAARLAQALGVDAEDVTKALEELKGERHEPGGFAADLADKLGLDAADVEAALMELRPLEGPEHEAHAPAVALRQLAAKLDVTRAELRKALREVRASADLDRQDRRDDLVKFLANRFNLSEAKVDEALPQFAGRGPCGPHRPGGSDGPGRFQLGPGGPPPGMP